MKMFILTVLLLSGCLLLAMGCSADGKKPEAKKEPVVAQNEASDSAKAGTDDSLAAVTFPIRNKDNQIVTLETDLGKMVVELYHDVAPAHADSFAARSKDGFYDGLIFHRVIKDFMIQGGDPQGTGMGNAGYFLPAEFSDLPHQDGTLSMARGGDPNSASCQFFVCLGKNRATSSLNGKYTVFGQLLKGYDVLHAIGDCEVVQSPNNPREISVPKEKQYIRKAYLSDAEGNPL
ncbi:MAG: peptidylprolyl isomerase [Candidatus Zixiibacteriota bacterium]